MRNKTRITNPGITCLQTKWPLKVVLFGSTPHPTSPGIFVQPLPHRQTLPQSTQFGIQCIDYFIWLKIRQLLYGDHGIWYNSNTTWHLNSALSHSCTNAQSCILRICITRQSHSETTHTTLPSEVIQIDLGYQVMSTAPASRCLFSLATESIKHIKSNEPYLPVIILKS